MLNGDGVPLFAGIEDTDDLFIAAIQEMDKEVSDEITIAHPLWRYIEKMNKIEYRSKISTHVPVKIMDKPNSTVKSFTHYDELDLIPQDALKEARFAYGQIAGTQMYSREELIKSGEGEGMVDLVEQKTTQLKTSMSNHFGDLIIGTQDANGRDFMGIGRIMTPDAKVGTIDPTVDGYGYWNPHVIYKTGTTKFSLATEFRPGMRKTYRDVTYRGDVPDVVVCGEDVYEEHQKWAEDHLRVRIDEIKQSQGWGDFEMYTMNGKTIIYDAMLDSKTAWTLNFKLGVKVRIHSGSNFIFTPWEMLDDKIAKRRFNLVYCSVYCRRRNTNAVTVFS